MGIYTIISLAIGFIVILFFGWMMYVHYTNDDLEHWVPPTLIVGILIIMLFGSIGYGADKYEKIHGEIKNTITSNYNDVTNYHDDDRQSFVSDGIRYTFDYNKSQKTLTVFTNTSVVDATFVDGVKQKTGK
jgi:hypothetical protein